LEHWTASTDFLLPREAVAASDGPGGTTFISLDGRVFIWNEREGPPAICAELTDPKSVASVVVDFAVTNGFPELLELLPKVPPQGRICRLCGGARLMPKATEDSPDERPRVCSLCWGLGWTTAEPIQT
jgi:hypothetical protein